MSKYLMVDAVSMFRMRYVVEVPDDVENPKEGSGLHPCTPQVYAMDSVGCEDVREFSQVHLDEIITSVREVSLEEAIEQWRIDNSSPTMGTWTDDMIKDFAITEIGYDRKEHEEEQEKKWRMSVN